MVTIADLRKNRSNDMNRLIKSLENTNNYQNEDDGFWKLERDKAGNGTATIRFLPAYTGEDAVEADELPYVVEYSHAFQGPTGRWYIEKCRSTIKEDDPVNDMNRKLWKGSETEKEQARAQKRKTHYIAQILVISDPKNPDNNGKVFFYKFGKKIFDKITDVARPTFEDEKPVNVFDLWEGANLKLRIKTVEKYPNYDSSTFEAVSPIADSDEDILEIVKQQKSLGRFVDKSRFKSYEDLEKKLNSVLSSEVSGAKSAEDMAKQMREESQKAKNNKEDTPADEPDEKKKESEKSIADDDINEDYFNFDE